MAELGKFARELDAMQETVDHMLLDIQTEFRMVTKDLLSIQSEIEQLRAKLRLAILDEDAKR
jgi:hypothetical protein